MRLPAREGSTWLSALTGLALLLPSVLQAQSSEAVVERRRAVEASLLPQIMRPGEEGYSVVERMVEHRVPGLSIAVIRRGEVEWAAGYGVKRLGTADSVDVTTLFQAASISKPLAATAVLRLVDSGHLGLDDDVMHYLTSWVLPVGSQTAGNPVTLRRLLSHTAGVNVHGFGGVPRGSRLPTTTEVLEGGAGSSPIRVEEAPGDSFNYSGGGYQIVQLVLEEVTEEPFAGLMRNAILGPLGMARSTFAQPLPAELGPAAAVGHQRSRDRLLDTVPGGWYDHPAQAAAGLWTTPTDLARFALGIRAAWLGEPGAILSRESTQTMLAAQNGPWGLGVPVSGSGESLSFGHGGNSPGYASFFVLYPVSGDGVVVMGNGRTSGALLMEVVRAVARVYEWPGGDYAPRVSLSAEGLMLRLLLAVGGGALAVYIGTRWYRRSLTAHRTA